MAPAMTDRVTRAGDRTVRGRRAALAETSRAAMAAGIVGTEDVAAHGASTRSAGRR
jgi:hypothetical protein